MKRHSLTAVVLTFALHASCWSLPAQPAEPDADLDSPKRNTPDIKVFLWEPRAVEGLTETEGHVFGERRTAPRYYRYLRPGLVLKAGDVARLVKSRSPGSDRTHFEVYPTAAARKRLEDSIKLPGMHTRKATVIANGQKMSYMRLYVVNPEARVSTIIRADSFIFSFWVGSAEEADAVEATFKPPGVLEKTQTLPLHAQSTAAVCFSRNGLLATTSLDRTVKLWDMKQRQLIATLDGFPRSPEGTWDRDAVFSPDGSLLALAATGKAIQVYETETKRQLWRSDNGARSLAFAPNGKTFVTADWEDAAIRVWEARSGELLKTLQGTDATLVPDCWSQGTVAYAPDGKTFATAVGGADQTAKFPTQLTIWDAESLTPRTRFVPHKYRIHAMAYSPDGKSLAIGGVGGTLRLVSLPDPTNRDAAAKVVTTLRNHRGTIMGIAWSPDGKLLASCSREYAKERGRIVVWRMEDSTYPALEWDGPGVTSVQFSPDGKSMASSGQDGAVTLWQVNPVSASLVAAVPKATDEPEEVEPKEEVGPQATMIATLALPKSNSRWAGAHTVAVSPDGKTVFSAHDTSRSRIWDVEKQQARAPLNEHAGDVSDVGFSRDGKLAYAVDWSALKLFNALTGERIGEIAHELREDTVIGPTVGPDGQILTRDKLTSMRVWDLATRKPITGSLDGNRELRACRLSPDGRWAIGETGRRVLVWNVETGKLVGPFSHTGYGAAISRDGELLAVSTGEQMEIRDLATGDCIGKDLVHPTGAPSESLPGLVGTVPAIFADFGADKVLVTRDKNDAWFWFDVDSDTPRSHKLPMGGRMKAVRFLGDGRRAATVSEDAIAVWQVGVAEPLWRKTFENGSWRTEFTASSNGQWLLIHTRNQESIVYSAATGQVVAKETGAMGAHVDGEFFVTGSRETIKVWRLPKTKTGE